MAANLLSIRSGWLLPLCLVPYLAGEATNHIAEVQKAASEALRAGRLPEAIEQIEALLQKERIRNGSDIELATILNTLGTMYHDADRLPEAERCYKEAIQVCRSAGGMKDEKLIPLLTNLAGLRVGQAKYTEAEKLYKDAEQVAIAVFGPASPELAIVWNGLTYGLLTSHRRKEAQKLAERALPLLESSRFHGHAATTLSLLGRIAFEDRSKAKAEDYTRRALSKWEASVGIEHPSYASSLADLAVLLSEDRPAEATALFKQSLETIAKTLGPTHSYYGSVTLLYAAHLKRYSHKAEARELKRFGESILRTQHGRNGLSATVDIQTLQAPEER